ncbi:WavE lipopolysaccharide synthesis family protein [Shewanella sp. NIFS-20-20]|nr:WavE lipopolysaccharide synthesis family protein [Shewanella sp. NIFS-20-20]MBV7316127.1 WavE lipopolysaccharide synthesis family protein [Shewanella sp. NIFS-20-20]
MIRFNDISVVLQGPVQASAERLQVPGITHHCIASIREFLPGATVILSTWEGQGYSGLIPDILLLNQDPRPNVIAKNVHGNVLYQNFNRQIVSTQQGLSSVTTKYAVKLRADNYLLGNQFVFYQQDFPKRAVADRRFQQRVVFSSCYFRKFSEGFEVIMHPSDYFNTA